MADETNNELLEMLRGIADDPDEAVRLVQRRLADIGGIALTVTDPGNPFMNVVEFAAAEGSNILSRNLPIERRLYPSNATTPEEVYLHMSDKDLVGTHAQPGKSVWILGFSLEEVRKKAVQIPNSTSRKLTIPRNTVFRISEYNFGIYYPIDIVVDSQGGISVVYDTSELSPLRQLESNVLSWDVRNMDGIEYLAIRVPAEQFSAVTHRAPADPSTGFDRTFDFTGQYYYCRIFGRNASSEPWTEIRTTFTDQVYDPTELTAVLKVTGQNLRVFIPQAYFNQGGVFGSLRIDVYTTLGSETLNIGDYQISDYIADWRDFNRDETSQYVAPIVNISNGFLTASGESKGGREGLSLDEIRERVIWNAAGNINTPITPNQLDNAGEINGFNIVKKLDVVTSREYWATRRIPGPNSADGIAPAAATMETLSTTFSKLLSRDTVADHNQRVTVYPNTLYSLENGVLSLAESSELPYIESLGVEDRAAYLNQKNLFYSPFYYVLDITGQKFETRVYDFARPSAESINFEDANVSTQLSFSTQAYSLLQAPDNTGFYLDILTRCNDTAQQLDPTKVKLQLSYLPRGLGRRVFMTASPLGGGVNSDGNYVFRFHIQSEMDVTSDDEIVLSSFLYADNTPRDMLAPLMSRMDLVYCVEDWQPSGQTTSGIDNLVGSEFLSSTVIGVSHESISLKMGNRLDTLWTRSRTILVDVEYATYPADVPAVYESAVYEIDPLTGKRAFTYDAGPPATITYNKLYDAGDPVLDENDDPVLAHAAGDPVLDAQGDPVPLGGPYEQLRTTDIFLIDARYYFATSRTTVAYRDSFIETVVGWILNDISGLQARALDNTFLFFHPTKTSGSIDVITDEGRFSRVPAEQSIVIRATFTNENYQNQTLQESVRKRTVDIIQSNFANSTVDASSIVKQVREALGGDVLGIDIVGVFGDAGFTVATIRDGSKRFTIAKRAVGLPDGTIAVEDDVTFTPLNHRAVN